ncbi:hypothetical protein [Bacillus velezensis]|uniref:hypothetical protein n=1 Tax=Bacillus velezensis TaxID=492670 RepID=UPI003D053079
MVKFIQYVGFAILAVGIMAFLYLGFGLKTYTPGLSEGYMYAEPHPLRWIYATASFLGSAFFGSVLIGLSRILHHKESESSYIREIQNDLRLMKAREGITK